MPSEVFRMHFKPVGFFDKSPALDMPPSTQAVNKSTHAKCDVSSSGEKSSCCAM